MAAGPGLEGPGSEGSTRASEAALEVRWGRPAQPPHAPEPGWGVRCSALRSPGGGSVNRAVRRRGRESTLSGAVRATRGQRERSMGTDDGIME